MPRCPSPPYLHGGLLVLAVMLMGCATPLTSGQKAELNVYRTKGMEVTEKDPAIGKALGVLPGGGSIYAGEYRTGAINFLLWPMSVMWDPISGSNGSEAANYRATRRSVDQSRAADLHVIETKLAEGMITEDTYLTERERIERKYAPEI